MDKVGQVTSDESAVKPAQPERENSYLLEESQQTPEVARDSPENRTCRRPLIVEIPAFIYFLGYRACLPLKEQLVYVYMAAYYLPQSIYIIHPNETSSTCDQQYNTTAGSYQSLDQKIQADSSQWLSFFNIARNIPALFAALLICSLTDVYGRKLGLLMPSLFGAIKAFLFILFLYLRVPIQYYLLGEFLEGVGGSIMTGQSVVNLYLSDILSKKQLVFRFMVVQGLQFLATALGNFAIGYLISYIGYIKCFWVIACLYSLNVLYIAIVLPESLEHDRKINFNARETIKNAIGVFEIYYRKTRDSLVNNKLMLMLIVVLLDNFILLGRNDVDVLYFLGSPFCWSSVTIGYFQATKYILKGIGGIFAVRVLQTCIRDYAIGAIGCISGTLGNLLMGLATSSLLLWLVAPFGMLSGMTAPVAQAIMSALLSSDDQAALFASLGVLEGVCDLVSGALLNLLFSATVIVFRGLVFILIASFYLMAAVCFIASMWLNNRYGTKEASTN